MAWQPDYCTAAQLKSWLRIGDTADDTLLAFCITGASRDVDQFTGRQFGLVSTAEVRHYQWDGRLIEGRAALEVDDFQTVTGLVVHQLDADGVTTSTPVVAVDYDPWPFNATQQGKPWTHLVARSATTWSCAARSTSVEAKWGWTTPPSSVVEATLITATEGFAWRNTPFGVAGSPDMGNELRVLRRIPVRAEGLLAHYKRHWGRSLMLDLNALMDALGVRLATISGLRVFDFTADSGSPPVATIGLPSEGEYDYTKGRGSDRVVVPVAILIGKVVDRSARDDLAGYIAGSGAKSVKAAVDGTLGGAVHFARVMGWRTDEITLNGAAFLGVTFDVEAVS